MCLLGRRRYDVWNGELLCLFLGGIVRLSWFDFKKKISIPSTSQTYAFWFETWRRTRVSVLIARISLLRTVLGEAGRGCDHLLLLSKDSGFEINILIRLIKLLSVTWIWCRTETLALINLDNRLR